MTQIQPGTLVDHFRVTRLIGHGAMGQVYLGRDVQLGRRVALKVIHPDYLRSPGARERFLKEARTTARFSHPHIVTIYAVGEREGQPYLAMEYLEGQNLRQRLSEDRASLDPLRVALAIAQALAEAHQHGVVHRDLKPDNVVIPRDGRPRVLDFGLAASDEARLGVKAGEGAERSGGKPRRSGTPAYMAPEQWRRGEISPASDVWALGIMLHELMTGERPFAEQEASLERLALRVSDAAPVPESEALRSLPPPLRALIRGCLDKDPAARPRSEEVAEQLRQALVRELRPADREQCPFPGLRPFTEGQAPLFFGREPEVDAFLERLREVPILPIVGPSGAGKSSFVRAGVIPRLKERTSWIVLDVTPGNTPFLALGAALAPWLGQGQATTRSADTVSDPGGEGLFERAEEALPPAVETDVEVAPRASRLAAAGLAEELAAAPGSLGQRLRRLAAREHAQVLLFVDQLEELYTLAEDQAVRRQIMEMLCTAADDPADPVRLIFTLRDDYLGRLAEGEQVRETLSRVTVLRSPGPAALEEILRRPLEVVGYGFEPRRLTGRMVEAVKGEASSLPLIQFTARLLWERRDRERRLLTEEIYELIGGVEGALAEHADGVLEGMTPEQVGLARELLLRLITHEGTRCVVAREAILEGLGAEGEEVLGRLIQARLVSVRRALSKSETSAELELVHESLIRGWERLSRWFDEGREDLAFLAQVSQAAELWDERGRLDAVLWQGEALGDALRDARRLHRPPELVRDFLEAGQRRERRAQRRRRGLWASLISLLALVALVSTAGAVALSRKEEEAQAERRAAEVQRLHAQEQGAEALREGARAAMLRGDLVQARAMLRAALQTKVTPLGQALLWRLAQEPLLWRRELGGDVDALAFSPDGAQIAALADTPSVYVFRVDDMALRILRGHRHKPDDVAFSPDGRWLASTSSVGTLRLWDLRGEGAEPAFAHEDAGGPLAFSPQGHLLVTGHRDGMVRVWAMPTAAGARPRRLGGAVNNPSPIAAIAVDPAGELAAASSMDGHTHLYRIDSGELLGELSGDGSPALSVAFNPRGDEVAVGSSDATVRIWRLQDLAAQPALLLHPDAVRDLGYAPSGDQLASGSAGGSLHLWDVATGRELGRLAEGQGQVLALAFSPSGALIATGGTDQSLRLYRREQAFAAEADRGHAAAVLGVALSPDGHTLASGSNDQTVRLWSLETGEQLAVLRGSNPARVTGVAYSPDGARLAAACGDGNLRLWDSATGRQLRSPVGPRSYLSALAFVPGQDALVTASFDGAVRLWDPSASRPARELMRHEAWATDVALSPDGRWLASSGHDRAVRLWDVQAGRERLTSLTELPGEVHGLAFRPDSRALAFSVEEQPAQLWELGDDSPRPVGGADSRIYWLAFHPDGRRLGLPRADGTAHIVSEGGEAVVLRGHLGEVNYLRFTADGRLAVTTSDDGTVRLWDVETGRPRWWAPALLGQPPNLFSQRGWTTPGEGQLASARDEAPSGWRRAIEGEARLALESSGGGVGCLATFDGQLQLWDLEADELSHGEAIAGLEQLLALDRGCVTLKEGQVRLLRTEGDAQALGDGVAAIALGQDGRVLLAAGGEVRLVDASEGEVFRSVPAGSFVEVMLDLGDELVLGFGDGGLEVRPVSGSSTGPLFAFEGLPASPPVALIAGPRQTLVAGFQNGVVGLWSLEDGSRIFSFRLHGPARYLRLVGERLMAATELGDQRALDLTIFLLDECPLLQRLWREVPVVWDEGAVIRRSTPRGHRCTSP